MSFLLDTNVCSAHIRRPSGLAHRFIQYGGRLHAELARAGRPMNAVDQMIASVALVHGLTLVTHNVEDFRHVPDLRIEDWLAP